MTINLADLSLFPGTSQQVLESRIRSREEWSNGLSTEAYLERGNWLATREHAKDGKLTVWVLAPRNNPETLDFLCSCETFLRRGFVFKNGITETVSCYGIASVITPVQYRGKGYAKHMMRLLHWTIGPQSMLGQFPSTWGAPPSPRGEVAAFSSLWSDVGDFYASCGPRGTESGWEIREPLSTVWDLGESDIIGSEKASENWKYLKYDEIAGLWPDETERMKNEMDTGRKHVGFAYLPDGGTELFQRERVQSFIQVKNKVIDDWGVSLGHSFSTWTFEGKPVPTLLVTYIRVEKEELHAMLYKIREAALKYGMTRIEIWGLREKLRKTATQLGGQHSVRKEHISAFKWYGEESSEDVIWWFNERFCWC